MLRSHLWKVLATHFNKVDMIWSSWTLQNIPVVPKLVKSENASATMLETNGIVMKEKGVGELPQIFTHKEVQKEWTCALCHVTTTSEKTLNSHLQGSKHKKMEIALKAKNQPVSQKLKSDHSKEELKQKNIYQPKFKTKNGEKPTRTNNSEIRCEICNVKCPCEITLASHRKGKKHLDKVKSNRFL